VSTVKTKEIAANLIGDLPNLRNAGVKRYLKSKGVGRKFSRGANEKTNWTTAKKTEK